MAAAEGFWFGQVSGAWRQLIQGQESILAGIYRGHTPVSIRQAGPARRSGYGVTPTAGWRHFRLVISGREARIVL